jgi:predicted CopG family antitoxin
MENTTITVTEKVWKELSIIKINAGYKTISEVIEHLLFSKKEKHNDNAKI